MMHGHCYCPVILQLCSIVLIITEIMLIYSNGSFILVLCICLTLMQIYQGQFVVVHTVNHK